MNYDLESDEKSSGFFSAGSVLSVGMPKDICGCCADAEPRMIFQIPKANEDILSCLLYDIL